MIGGGALRCKKKNAESRDVRHEQLKRRPVPRSGTRNGPREKENEHTPTVNVEPPRAHSNSECGTAKGVIALQRNNEKQTAPGILREIKSRSS